MRATHFLLGEEYAVEMLLYADDLEVVAPSRKGRIGAVLAFLYMASFGSPFKWAKQRGGILMVMRWIARKMSAGLRMQEVRKQPVVETNVIRVWTDAKATDTDAWIGGWVEELDNPKGCRWFSEKVEDWMAPWLRLKWGNPKRVIAALEMLATLVALKLWSCDVGNGGVQVRTVAFTHREQGK